MFDITSKQPDEVELTMKTTGAELADLIVALARSGKRTHEQYALMRSYARALAESVPGMEDRVQAIMTQEGSGSLHGEELPKHPNNQGHTSNGGTEYPSSGGVSA